MNLEGLYVNFNFPTSWRPPRVASSGDEAPLAGMVDTIEPSAASRHLMKSKCEETLLALLPRGMKRRWRGKDDVVVVRHSDALSHFDIAGGAKDDLPRATSKLRTGR